jgi:type IV secretion system protein VirB9
MTAFRLPVAACLLLACAPLSLAHAGDARIRVVTYSANEVVPLRGHYGYQMLIAFAHDERIGNISIGDSAAWLVTPNKDANGVFLKPVEPRAATNMTVQTDRRTYLFELTAAPASRGGSTAGMLYKLQFRYPEPARPSAPASVAYNRDYKMTGAAALRPSQVFDDGQATYFVWPAGAQIPAIFAKTRGKDELVNHATRGGYVVVDRVAPAFTLRAGKDKVRVINKRLAAGGRS